MSDTRHRRGPDAWPSDPRFLNAEQSRQLRNCIGGLLVGQCPAEPPDMDRTEEYREREVEIFDWEYEQFERELHGDRPAPSFYS